MSTMDDFLKNKLFDHSSELPKDMWQKIEAGINEDTNKRGFFIYFLTGFLFLFFAGSLTYFIWPDSSIIPTEQLNLEKGIMTTPVNSNLVQTGNAEKNIPEEKVSLDIVPSTKVSAEVAIVQEKSTRKESSSDQKTNLTNAINENESSDIFLSDSIDINYTNNSYSKSNHRSIEALSQDLLGLEMPERSFNDPIGCPTFSSRRSIPNLFIEGYAGLVYAQQRLAIQGAETSPDYLQLRRDSEAPLISWMAGINVGWISKYNVGIKGGLNFETINERFRYTDSIAVRNQTVITIDTMFNTDGSISSITSDTSVQQIFGYEDQSVYNYHRTLNIPVELLYQFDLGAVDIEISGGAIFNIRYSNRGKIVDPSNEDRWFTNGENDTYKVFKDNFSTSLTFSVSALYSLNSHLQLFARPNIKYTLNTLSTSSSPFNQRYMNYGVSVGARYYFSENPNY